MARKTSRGHKSIIINIKMKWDEKKWAINVEFIYRRNAKSIIQRYERDGSRKKSFCIFSPRKRRRQDKKRRETGHALLSIFTLS